MTIRFTIAVVICWLSAWVGACWAADPRPEKDGLAPAAAAFEHGKIWKVHVEVSAKEFAAMQPRGGLTFPGAPVNPKPQERPDDPGRVIHRNTFGSDLAWAKGAITIDGKTFQNVGVRYKGNGTIADAARTIKKSLRIDLDLFGGVEQFHGMKTLNLHSGVADPSKFRETKCGAERWTRFGRPRC